MDYIAICRSCKDLKRCSLNKSCERFKCKIISCKYKDKGYDAYIDDFIKSNKRIMPSHYGYFSESINRGKWM